MVFSLDILDVKYFDCAVFPASEKSPLSKMEAADAVHVCLNTRFALETYFMDVL